MCDKTEMNIFKNNQTPFAIVCAALCYTFTLSQIAANIATADQPTLIIVQGASGQEEYGKAFSVWRDRWIASGKRGQAQTLVIGDDQKTNSKSQLKQLLTKQDNQHQTQPLWLVFLGHGTFDGTTAKFNLKGPDVSATELANWLEPIRRPIVFINCSSSSAPFLTIAKEHAAAQANRPSTEASQLVRCIAITATKSGHEMNFSRFGDFLSASIADPKADIDKDGQTSLLEAYLLASQRTQAFYDTDNRLATEQALLDDNGDGFGTPAAFFKGVRAVKKAENSASLDRLTSHQIHLVPSERERNMPPAIKAKRNALERKLEVLRQKRNALGDDSYFKLVEPIAYELAKLYDLLDSKTQSQSN